MKTNNGNVALAILVGAAIGAGFGVLYAPEKGSKTRRMIKRKAMDAGNDLTHRINEAKEQLTQSASKKREAFENRLEDSLSQMSYKADDIIAGLEHKLEDLRKKNAQLQK
ncbi:YtxH domain-containing protein [Robiginitalea sp.]|uniref:YtxH domain-containing protein n=1 Tax=Robiginitalea sp. TaxID=1902411 RepID=UPI003C7168D3